VKVRPARLLLASHFRDTGVHLKVNTPGRHSTALCTARSVPRDNSVAGLTTESAGRRPLHR